MSNLPDSSKLLEMLDALSTPDADLAVDDLDLSLELEQQIRRYALNTFHEADPSEEDADLEEQLVKGLVQQPRGLLLLRSLLNNVLAVEQLGPVPDTLIQQQLSKFRGAASSKPADFSVRLSKSGLRYAGKPPQRTTSSFELARDPGEGTTLLQHEQRLNHCGIKVTIETGANQTFTLVLEFTFVEPRYKDSLMQVTIADDANSIRRTQAVIDRSVEYEDLPAGCFTLEIQAGGFAIDQFRAELQHEDSQ
jgi:hypothetical protein